MSFKIGDVVVRTGAHARYGGWGGPNDAVEKRKYIVNNVESDGKITVSEGEHSTDWFCIENEIKLLHPAKKIKSWRLCAKAL